MIQLKSGPQISIPVRILHKLPPDLMYGWPNRVADKQETS